MIIFTEGFETGVIPAEWGTGGSVSIVGTPVHHGLYSAMFTGSSYIFRTISAMPDAYARAYFRFPAVLPIDTSLTLFRFYSPSWTTPVLLMLLNQAGNTYLGFQQADIPTSYQFVPFTIVPNMEYCLEIHVKTGATNGEVTVQLNGTQIVGSATLALPENFGVLVAGSEDAPAGFVTYMDDLVLADTPIGPDTAVEFNLTIDSALNGSTSPPAGTYAYAYNSIQRVTANPNSGYALYYWLKDGVNIGAVNPLDVLMDNNHNLTPYFAVVGAGWSLNASVSGTGGTVAPSGNVQVTEGQSLVVVASPSSGYAFDYWLLDGVQVADPNPITVPAQTSGSIHALQAVFKQQIVPPPPPTDLTLPLIVVGGGVAVIVLAVALKKKKKK